MQVSEELLVDQQNLLEGDCFELKRIEGQV